MLHKLFCALLSKRLTYIWRWHFGCNASIVFINKQHTYYIHVHVHIYTVGHKKTCHFYCYDNFGKCGPISIILSLLDS